MEEAEENILLSSTLCPWFDMCMKILLNALLAVSHLCNLMCGDLAVYVLGN